MSRKPRGLRPDEVELWRRVAENSEPLKAGRTRSVEGPVTKPEPRPAKPRVQDFRIGEAAKETATRFYVAPALPDGLGDASVNMDPKAFTKLKRGKLKPEGRIDLHGMTLARAHPALTRFVIDSHAVGKRLVLVITGKGRPSEHAGPIPERTGILRHQVPQWLSAAPLGALVLQVTPAHLKHGGAGAYYVYLRRQR